MPDTTIDPTRDYFPAEPFMDAGLTYPEVVLCATSWASHSVGDRAAALALADGPLDERKAAVDAVRDVWAREDVHIGHALPGMGDSFRSPLEVSGGMNDSLLGRSPFRTGVGYEPTVDG